MKRIPVTNTGDAAAYIAGVLVQPGETRMVDALQVSTAEPVADAPAEQQPTLLDLLDRSVKDIVEALPSVSGEDLDTLEAAEQAGKTRKGVLEAIAADRIRRAKPAE